MNKESKKTKRKLPPFLLLLVSDSCSDVWCSSDLCAICMCCLNPKKKCVYGLDLALFGSDLGCLDVLLFESE